MTTPPVIGLVDDDPAMLRALRRLFAAEGFQVRSFEAAEQLLPALDGLDLDCLVLDVNMPGLGGLGLQEHLNARPNPPPVVFLTGRGDIPMTVQAMRAGAVNFLTKPVNDSDLLDAVRAAVAVAAERRRRSRQLADESGRLARLTPREREVFRHLIAGRLNKQIAADLGTSEQTIKVHRMRIHDKMGVCSVAELVHIASRLGIPPASPRETEPREQR